MKAAHLFDGIGGFHLATDRANMETLWVSEIDRHASNVSDHHWPNIKNLGDIHGVQDPPRVDVLTGGFPCQDYSVAGKRGGLAADRGALWWEFHRLIDEGRPRWVVGENVPGLLSSRDGRDFATIIDSLVDLGYGVVWRVLDAQWFGVAQRRRRVFIVGHLGGEPRPEILTLGQSVSGDTPPRRKARTRPSTRVAVGIGGSDLSPSVTTPSGGLSAKQNQYAYVIERRTGLRTHDEVGPTLQSFMGTGGNNTPMVATSAVRRLTPLECERLQGFPDGWTDIPGNADTQRYRQLGNAVAIPVVEWIMGRIANLTP